MKRNFVSVIIVNYNGKGLLKALIGSILKSSFRNYEMIIVDNGSSDGSREFVKKNYKNVNLVENRKNLGYSGINSALRYCNGEYILFLNNDMELDNNCIKFLVESIKSDKDIAMAAPKLVNFYDRSLKSGGTWVSRAFYNGHIKGNGSSREVPYLGVGLIRKDFVDTFGYLFEPDYFIGHSQVIDVRGQKLITPNFLPKKITAPIIFFYTDHVANIFDKNYFKNNPVITNETAQSLVRSKVRVVGIDSFTPDNFPYEVHKILFSQNILIVENLTNLGLIGKKCRVIIAPLKLTDADGAPARIFAQI